jgi:glycosyltransferase involved in cell wall biosynthesis
MMWRNSHRQVLDLMTKTKPASLVTLDIEDSLPDLRPDDQYDLAWVLLLRRGVPCTLVEVDLTTDPDAIRARIQESIGRCESILPVELDHAPIKDEFLPHITVVIPSIVKRVDALSKCIDSLDCLDYPNFEVIIVDNRPVVPTLDPLPSLIGNRPWLRSIRESTPGASAARNAGIAVAEGEVVAFTDDDVQVDRGWLRAIGTRMALNPHLEAVNGLILPAELDTPAQVWFERYYGGFGAERTFAPLTLESDDSVHRLLKGSQVLVRDASGAITRRCPVYGIGAYGAGANMAFRKSSLQRNGKFDTSLGIGTPTQGGEDLALVILILGAGGQVAYEPGAFVRHQHRREFAQLESQLHGYGMGYTAMLTSLIVGDYRHLLGVLSQLPLAFKRRLIQGARQVGAIESVESLDRLASHRLPASLARAELLGYLQGPLAYLKSRRAVARHRRR